MRRKVAGLGDILTLDISVEGFMCQEMVVGSLCLFKGDVLNVTLCSAHGRGR